MAYIEDSKKSEVNINRLGFMAVGGEMGALTRAFDWSKTSLGPADSWPQSLRTTVSIILHSKFPMLLWWGQDLVQFYNDAYRTSLGNNGKHPSALGQRGRECWPETWPIIGPLIDGVLSGGEAIFSEDQLVPIYRNGRVEDAYWTFGLSPVYEESGKVGGVLVVCSEATEKVTNLKKLEESESRFRNMVQQAPVAFTLTRGLDMVIESINAPVLRIMGKEKEDEVLEKKLMEALPEVKGQPIQGSVLDVLKTGKPFTGAEVPVSLLERGKLEEHYFNVSCTPLIEEGAVTGVLHLATDVTEQVLARKEVEEGQEALKRFKFMADQARDAFILMREDGTFAYLNHKALEAWGYSGEEAMLIRVPDVDPIYQEEKFSEAFALAQKQSIPTFETLHKRKDGTIYPVEISMGGITLDGKPHMFAVARDITERKQAEETLKTRNEQLQRVNNELDNFIYTASHDLKAPIYNIEGLLTLLFEDFMRGSMPQGEVEHVLNLMQKSVNRFKKTIESLTDVVKLQQEAGTDAVLVDLAEVIREVTMDLGPVIESAGVQLETDLGGCPSIRFSERNLRSVVYNLLSNAVKYRSPERVPRVQISCHRTYGYHVVTVTDNGLGIESKRIGEVFNMFRRFHDHVEGTGIGLYMVKKIMDNAGGRIEVESQVGESTTLRAYFPC